MDCSILSSNCSSTSIVDLNVDSLYLRSEFVSKVIFTHCTPLHELNCIHYGWTIVSNKVDIVWDDAENIEKLRQVRLVVARAPS